MEISQRKRREEMKELAKGVEYTFDYRIVSMTYSSFDLGFRIRIKI